MRSRSKSTTLFITAAAASIGLAVAGAAPGAAQPRAGAPGVAAPAQASTTPGPGTPGVLAVDLGADTGAVHGGATGALYALGQDGVPSANTLAPLHLKAIAQKPTDGLQHPSGDFDHIAPEFFATGGRQVFVYVQDALAKFPYEDRGIADYLTRIDPIIADVVASPYRRGAVYVPFNEPDNIWYDLHSGSPGYATQLPRYLADWTTVVRHIRQRDPGAVIAGPNTSSYDARFLSDFLTYAKANDVLPEVTTWHELGTDFFGNWYAHHDDYRALETRLGLRPIPVDIDEYGDRRDLSQPGQMIQWMSRFETSKVDAMQAYWDITENLQDNVVRTNEANGSWWLLQWYGSLTGHTVAVTPPDPNGLDSLQGIATLDSANRQARVVFGGSGGTTTVRLSRVPAAVGGTAHVVVERTSWSGYEGTAPTPPVVLEGDYPVRASTVAVPLTTDTQSAYRMTVTPAVQQGPVATGPAPTLRYEAEDATLTDATVNTLGVPADANVYHASGDRNVGPLTAPDSRVAFDVTVPATGTYRADVVYGNGTGAKATQFLRVDSGAFTPLVYPPTLNTNFTGVHSLELPLTAGHHRLVFAVGDPSVGTALGAVTLDRLDLTRLAPVTTPQPTTYPAEGAPRTGSATIASTRRGYTGTGYVTPGATAGGSEFVVTAPTAGAYRVDTRYATPRSAGVPVTRSVDGVRLAPVSLPGSTTAQPWRTATQVVYLTQGINRLALASAGGSGLAVDSLTVTPAPDDAVLGATNHEAESAALAGTAAVVANPYASGGSVVTGIGTGPANTLTFGGIEAPVAGTYAVTVSYSDAERNTPDHYNTDLIDEYADVSVNGTAPQRVYFRNTYSRDQFDPRTFYVTLGSGTNTIRFADAGASAPDIDRVVVSRLSSK